MLLARMRLPFLLAILFASCSMLCTAQVAARHTVTGTVVNSATGEPIRRALVAVGGFLVFTGADGRFQAENVPEGQTMIAAQKPGYFECAEGGCQLNRSPARVMVNVQAGTTDVMLKLLPESRIEGRVVDEDGDPLRDVPVQAIGEHIANGQKQFRPDSTASTDDNGTYRIENLIPGTYIVKTMPRPAFWSEVATETAPHVYPQSFFPAAPDAASAQPLNLQPGQAAVADFRLTAARAFRITGSIAPIVPNLALSVEDADGTEISAPFEFDGKSGKFSLSLVPAGTWTLNFSDNEPNGRTLSATQTITVASNDVKGLRILLQPLPSVPLNFMNGQAMVQLVSTLPGSLGNVFGEADPGSLDVPHVISGVAGGHYRTLVSVPGNQCVDTLTSGNLDLTREELIVSPGSQPQPIDVTLRSDCATLQVTAHSPNQNTQPIIVVVPASHAMQPVTGQLDASGTFVLPRLSPGEYQVYAFSNIDGLEYANPEVMREFSGQQITLSANQRANVTLEVISRAEN